MGYYWTCPNGHVSSWGDDEDPREWGGCPYCGGGDEEDADERTGSGGGIRN